MAYRNLKPKAKAPDFQEELVKMPSLDEMWDIHDNGRSNDLGPRI
jgi:hypothetical protein